MLFKCPRLIHQHNGNTVPNGIGEFGAVGEKLLCRRIIAQRLPRQRADKNFQQFRIGSLRHHKVNLQLRCGFINAVHLNRKGSIEGRFAAALPFQNRNTQKRYEFFGAVGGATRFQKRLLFLSAERTDH